MMEQLLGFITAPTGVGAVAMLLLKSTLVISMGFLLWLALRRASASARHLVLGATLVAILVLPAISIVAPALPLPLLSPNSDAPENIVELVRATDSQATGQSESIARTSNSSATFATGDTLNMFLLTYFLVASALLAYLLLGVLRILWISRNATDISHSRQWKSILNRHNKLSARIVTSEEIDAPLTWGVFRPVVLLPATAELWGETDQSNALLHELAHIERKDWLMQMLARIVCAVYWFNPLVWITLRQLVLEAELAADDQVLESGARPDDYAQQLVALTQGSGRSTLPVAATTMAERSMLTRRVHSILNSGDKKMSLNQIGRYAVLSIVSVTAMIVGSATLVAAPQDESTYSSTTIVEADAPALIQAAVLGDNAEVIQLLRSGVDVNEVWRDRPDRNNFARTALTNAAGAGHVDVVTTLLDAGAPVDRVVRGDATALIAATLRNHTTVTTLLLDRGADANLAVRGDGSPLIAATRANNPEVVRMLLERGADPDLSVRGDENPLYHAARNGNDEIMDMLINAGVDINQEWPGDGTALMVATESGNDSTAEALIQAGARPDQGMKRDGNAMIIAARRGDTALLQKMIATGADVNASVEGDGSPLIQAARNGHMEAVVLLLQAGADIDKVVAGDENALIGAAWEGDAEMVDYLLRSGADPTIEARSYGQARTALSQAKKGGHDDVVRMLQDAGATD